MTIHELIPAVASLSHADKLRLAQIMLQKLAQEEGVTLQPVQSSADTFEPRRYFGVAHHSRQVVDDYLASVREGWNS